MQRQVVYVGGGFSFLFFCLIFILFASNFWWYYFFIILFVITFVPTAGYYGYAYVVDEIATLSSKPMAFRPDLKEEKDVLLQ